MKKFASVAFLFLLFPWVDACSVGMAMSGKADPNLGLVRIGATRGEVELQLGPPVKSASTAGENRVDVYEYEIGNEPSAGRAAAHAVLDLLTLALWEVVGTPIEGVQGEKYRITLTYDSADRVVSINQPPPPATTKVTSGHSDCADSVSC